MVEGERGALPLLAFAFSRLWDERGRPEDLLSSGNAVTEYALWCSRYPGGLSVVEEAFGSAMVALAYAMASLERADRLAARMLVLDAVARGPIVFIADDGYPYLAFSPDGRWPCADYFGEARVWASDGTRSVFRVAGGGEAASLIFPPDGRALVTVRDLLRAWELPTGALLGELEWRGSHPPVRPRLPRR